MQVTLHPSVIYGKEDSKLVHQSYVFVSNESQHKAKLFYALLRNLVPVLLQLVPDLKIAHY